MENVPKEAQYYLPLKNDKKIATLFYKVVNNELYYLSTCGGGWFPSAEKDIQNFIKNNLIKIN